MFKRIIAIILVMVLTMTPLTGYSKAKKHSNKKSARVVEKQIPARPSTENKNYLFPLEDPMRDEFGRIICTSWFSKYRIENENRYEYQALNYPCRYGTKIFAPADGVVTNTKIEGYEGAAITVTFDDGMSITISHLSKYIVIDGQGELSKVKRGQVIALSGTSGRTTGSHVRIRFDKDGQRAFCCSTTWGMPYGAFNYVQGNFNVSDTMMYAEVHS